MMRDYNTQAVGIYSRAGRRNLSRLMVTSALVAAGSLALSGFAVAADYELPTGGVVTHGGATFSTPSIDKLRINQSTGRVVINWNTFNIGADATVKFVQPSSNALAVNKVSNDGQFSRINGRLLANGKVVILDPNGIIFGKDSVVNVGAILASTGDIDSDRVMAGDTSFILHDFGTGSVENRGLISVADTGLVALVAPTVKNSGVINAKLGRVSLAAGSSTATVDLYGDGLVELAYTNRNDDLLAKNTGEINALGGTIQMSAAAAKNVVDSVVNMDGVAHANSATVTGGKIVLSARHVKVGASADVKGDTTISAKRLDLGSTIDGSVAGSAKTVNVLSDAAKIAQGLNVVDAGGTVNVAAGTYNEHLVIDKADVTLNGAKSGVSGGDASRGTGETVVNPKSPGVTVTADGVVVDGMMFSGATGLDGYGIFVNGASNVTLRNNVVTNTSKDGIYILGGANNAVLNNNIGTLGGGYNIVGDGVLVKDSRNDVVQGNVISKIASPTSEVGSGVQVINGNGVLVGGALAGQGNIISNTQWDAVKITGGTNITVEGNKGTNLKRAGVYGKDTNGLTVRSNDIEGVGLYGIQIDNMVGTAYLVGNAVDRVGGYDGISVRYSSVPIYVSDNKVGYGDDGLLNTKDDTSIARDGLAVLYASNLSTSGNAIAHTKRYGVNVEGGSNLYLGGNAIDFTGKNGVNLYKTTGANIVGNSIGMIGVDNNINGDGILVDTSTGTKIRRNRINETTSTASEVGSGVHVLNSTNVTVGGIESGNYITNAEWDAVKVTNGSNILVEGNRGDNLKRAGIYGKGANGLTIRRNDINGAGMYGIQIDSAGTGNAIIGNTVDKIGFDGISVRYSNNPLTISGNMIGYGVDGSLGTADDQKAARDGIALFYANGVTISDNQVGGSGRYGIFAQSSLSPVISGNDVDKSKSHGIYLVSSNASNILSNFVGTLFGNGGDSVRVDNSQGANIDKNVIWNSGHDGVALYSDRGSVYVTENEIINSAHDGVYAYNTSMPFYMYDTGKAEMSVVSGINLHIVGNVIENDYTPVIETVSEKAALELPGGVYGNAAIELDIGERGYAEISANTMGTNFHYGLLAESGLIDLTGDSNTIHNSNIGMAFYPDNTDFEMPALVMDTAYYEYLANRLRLFDNTIGTTAFQDQSDLYVDLGYGAFFAPGYPTHLDGNHATYQQGASIIDSSLTGTITTSESNALEAMINHYVDSADRGLFFFNVVPDPVEPQAAPTFNSKDVFRSFSLFQAPGTGGSLIITGLPSVGGGLGRVPAQPPTVALNNITPAAGGEPTNPADIEPAAGDEQPQAQAQNVNDIQPAAGGEEGNNAPCWSDATRMLGAGSAVTVNFGGGAGQLLNDAAQCGAQNNGQPL